jgi:hypothetical protein
MPFFFDKAHYQSIANILKAGDVEAQTFSNPATQGVRVKLEDGSIITWTNSEGNQWAFLLVGPDGYESGHGQTAMAMQANAEDVAALIATFDYEAASEDKSLNQERLDRTEPIADEKISTDEV